MSTQVQFRRGTTAQHATFTGVAGEITVDTDKNVAVIHNGSTAGGIPLTANVGSTSIVTVGTLSAGAVPASLVTAGTFGAGAYVVSTSLTVGTLLASTTALATPSALAATALNAFASTVSGATLMGFGTTHDATLKNRAGTTALGVTANTTDVTMAGALAVTGATTLGTLTKLHETETISATASTGTINYDYSTQSILNYTTNATATWIINVRGNSSTTLASLMAVGECVTVVFKSAQGTTAYYPTSLTIDGTTNTPKWQGGTAPSSGNASSTDVYVYSITKTAATPTYTVLASQTKFA